MSSFGKIREAAAGVSKLREVVDAAKAWADEYEKFRFNPYPIPGQAELRAVEEDLYRKVREL